MKEGGRKEGTGWKGGFRRGWKRGKETGEYVEEEKYFYESYI